MPSKPSGKPAATSGPAAVASSASTDLLDIFHDKKRTPSSNPHDNNANLSTKSKPSRKSISANKSTQPRLPNQSHTQPDLDVSKSTKHALSQHASPSHLSHSQQKPDHLFTARDRIQHLGVMKRSPMGEYIDKVQLSQMAVPTPGPLDYDPKLPQSGVQYSILGKHASTKEGRDHIGPGPSKYDVRQIRLPFDDSPHWSFGHKFQAHKPKDDTPSPFAYTVTHKTFGTENNSYTMSSRYATSINETPGPDRYLPKPEFGPTGTGPKYSFGSKPITVQDMTPGPLDYKVPACQPSAPTSPKFTMRRRLDTSTRNKDSTPGPNQYYPVLPKSEKSASLKGIHKENKSLKTPGPANYIIPTNMFSGPHYTLIARNLPYQDDVYIAPNPGPADYQPDPKITLNKPPMCSLGSRPKSSKHENEFVPGPGAYHPRDRQIRGNDKPKVTIKGRHKTKLDTTPGPADYNSHVPASTVTPAQLERNALGRHVGAERLKSIIEESPGPADYNVKPISVVKSTGPAYSLRKRLESHKAEHSPGPNAYYAVPAKNTSKITMKSRMSPFVMVFPTNRVDTLRV